MTAHRVEHHDEGEVVHIALVVDGEWARAEFPHPLVTVDFDARDNAIGVTGVGTYARVVVRAYSDWLDTDGADTRALVAALSNGGVA